MYIGKTGGNEASKVMVVHHADGRVYNYCVSSVVKISM